MPATAASACSSVNAPAYSALPTIAPSTPSGARAAIARRSARLATPPLAITGRPVPAHTRRSRSRFGPVQRAVPGDVGDHEAGTAVRVEPGEGLPEVSALLRPSPGREPVPPHVEPDRDLLAELADHGPDPLRPFQRGGADVDAGAAGGERGRERGVVTDAAGQLDRDVEPAHHIGEQSRVGAAAERGVQVDQVDPLRPGLLPGQRGLERVAVAGLAARRALDQPYRLAAGHVHRGQQRQAHSLCLPRGRFAWSCRRRARRQSGRRVLVAGTPQTPLRRSARRLRRPRASQA